MKKNSVRRTLIRRLVRPKLKWAVNLNAFLPCLCLFLGIEVVHRFLSENKYTHSNLTNFNQRSRNEILSLNSFNIKKEINLPRLVLKRNYRSLQLFAQLKWKKIKILMVNQINFMLCGFKIKILMTFNYAAGLRSLGVHATTVAEQDVKVELSSVDWFLIEIGYKS